jgi:hypothetical protein
VVPSEVALARFPRELLGSAFSLSFCWKRMIIQHNQECPDIKRRQQMLLVRKWEKQEQNKQHTNEVS